MEQKTYLECNSPPYLEHDLKMYKKAKAEHLLEESDWWCKLYGSINSAYYDEQITEEQAKYLRRKYLDLEQE